MELLPRLPEFSAGDGLYFLILPYWQLMLIFVACTLVAFFVERRRIVRHLATIESESGSGE